MPDIVTTPYRVLVTGSRTWRDTTPIHVALSVLYAEHRDTLVIVHGACPNGADTIADRWAFQRLIPAERYPADWSIGRHTGHRRNADMIATKPDLCLAFILDESPGATGCVRAAAAAGIPTFCHNATS